MVLSGSPCVRRAPRPRCGWERPKSPSPERRCHGSSSARHRRVSRDRGDARSDPSMTASILDAFSQITRERAITRDELLEMVKVGLLAGVKRKFGPEANADISVEPASGNIRIFLVKEVVEQ